jgi:CxxC motif-containing protein
MKLICINCPRGCELEVTEHDGRISVEGHACPRGEVYGRDEYSVPVRMVTGLVKVAGTRRPLPVKTKRAVPKAKVYEITNLLANTTVLPPKRIGDVIAADVCGTGIDIVATANYC